MIGKKTLVIFGICAAFLSTVIFAESAQKYVNDDFGVSLMIPEEWEAFKSGHYNATVEFRRGKTDIPALGIFVSKTLYDPAVKTTLDFSLEMTNEFRKDSNVNIIEEPRNTVVNGLSATVFSIRTKEPSQKTVFYQFMVQEDVISVFATYEFDSQYDRLLEILSSFQLNDAEHSYRKLSLFRTMTPDFRPVDNVEFALLKNSILTALNKAGSLKTRYVVRDLTDQALLERDYKSVRFDMVYVSPQEFEAEKLKYADTVSKVWRVVDGKIYEKFNSWTESPDLSYDARIDPRVQKSIDAKQGIYRFLTMGKYRELFAQEKPIGIFDDQDGGYFIFDFEPKNLEYLLLDSVGVKPTKCRLWVWVDKNDHMIRLVRLVFRGFDAAGNPVKHKHDHYFRTINDSFSLGVPPLK